MKTTLLMRAGNIVHPSTNASGYCINQYVTDNGELGVVFASEVTKDSKKSSYAKNYTYDFVCEGTGIFIHKLSNGNYMVALNTPSCVTLLLCDKYGYGLKACVYRAGDPRNVGVLNLDTSVTDVIKMDKWSDVVNELDSDIVNEIKDTINTELRTAVTNCLTQNTPPLANEKMWDMKHDICSNVLKCVS